MAFPKQLVFRRTLGLAGGLGLAVLLLGAGQGERSDTATDNPFDVPLQLIAKARHSYQETTDYSCVFIKKEVIKGQMQPENLITMKVRSSPFSVYMYWHRPKAQEAQEACYVEGRNGGKMRAHSPGLLGAVGFVSIEPLDPRCLQSSRHAITEAGIGNLIERFGDRWAVEQKLGRTQVTVADYEYNKRRCTRVETIHPENNGKAFQFYRSLVYFDKQNHLPIRVENYDWPKPGGDPKGTLLESYSYANLKLNVGLPDATFVH